MITVSGERACGAELLGLVGDAVRLRAHGFRQGDLLVLDAPLAIIQHQGTARAA